MDYHQLLHCGLSVHRANKEFLKIMPATEAYRGIRSLIVRVNKKIERDVVVTPENILTARGV